MIVPCRYLCAVRQYPKICTVGSMSDSWNFCVVASWAFPVEEKSNSRWRRFGVFLQLSSNVWSFRSEITSSSLAPSNTRSRRLGWLGTADRYDKGLVPCSWFLMFCSGGFTHRVGWLDPRSRLRKPSFAEHPSITTENSTTNTPECALCHLFTFLSLSFA
jgi:hypothetical protein